MLFFFFNQKKQTDKLFFVLFLLGLLPRLVKTEDAIIYFGDVFLCHISLKLRLLECQHFVDFSFSSKYFYFKCYKYFLYDIFANIANYFLSITQDNILANFKL